MASLRKTHGRWILQFTGADKRRRTIRLGKISKRDAESVKFHVEQIVSALSAGGTTPDDTARWLSRLNDTLFDKLARVGLAAKRECKTLGTFLSEFVEAQQVKDSTRDHLRRVQSDLIGHFGPDKPLREFTAGDADDFRAALLGRPLGENTVRRRCGRCKQFFGAAIRRKLIDDNPFAHIKTSVQANPKRFHFVTREDTQKILDACPNAEWRLIVALSRYGGLRTPSETLALRWGDVNWETNRIRVRSPKTEHHVGKESRLLPIFPELRPHLEAAFDQAEPGTEFVITGYRGDSRINLRTQFLRIVFAAGVKEWQKPFANMRSTRETELAETFPMHVTCEWIGNSERIAAKHYLQTTSQHFERAIGGDGALQNPTQSVTEIGGNALQGEKAISKKPPGLQGVSKDYNLLQKSQAPQEQPGSNFRCRERFYHDTPPDGQTLLTGPAI